MGLNSREHHSHSRVFPRISHSAQSHKACARVDNSDPDPCPGWQRLLRGHTASEQAQIARLFINLCFRLNIGHFNAGYKRIAARAWTLR